MSHEQIRATEYPASHALAVTSVEGEHTHKVAQLHVDTRKADYLQERNHKERVIGGDVVEHTGNTESHRDNKGNACPCHNRIEHSDDCLFRHVLIAGYHAQKKTDRQEHSEDDKKYLREYHHARKQENEYRYPQIEDEQEEHHSQTVDDLRYRQIVIVVILDFRFHHVLTGRPVVGRGTSRYQSFHTVSPDFLYIAVAKLQE